MTTKTINPAYEDRQPIVDALLGRRTAPSPSSATSAVSCRTAAERTSTRSPTPH